MLLPTKHSHPDETVLAAATAALSLLKSRRAVSYDELQSHLTTKVRSAGYLFAPALSLLYILGLVEYRSASDVFEYVGAK